MHSSYFLQSEDGLQLFYQTWEPSNPRAVIIVVHGAGEHSGRYQTLSEQCVKQDIAVVAPDLRGFGQSDGMRGHVNTFQEYLDDLHKLMDWVSVKFAALPVFLFGHSLGGLVVIRYSQLHANETNGVILSAPALALRFKIPLIARKMLHLSSRVVPALSINPMKWQSLIRRMGQLAPYLPPEKALRHDPYMTAEITPKWLAELLQNGINALAEAATFRYPVLCVYDEKDPIVQPAIIQSFLDKLEVDKKRLAFNDGFHHILHPSYHKTTIADILQWMDQRL
ncbi:Lysophospholipase, alpha-beta hydrolase superfamily [Gracilibacillus ureilyticus]|uniref:Lysophospholipase, alpha-beta hydrolase superfamily n=1 Tax=Gracilibacillus ureilyticus TaxID=531814 RepID=A0A1H9MMN5_9BACI|nr:alpha/beta hydrolase [Gracilibacillus ureilyticus]SER24974.1 Lysophospholipase, alpha-beta hydrolase superfamily [Gracilibacillus ureilyticus]